MRIATLCTLVGIGLFAVANGAGAQDMNGMNGGAMGQGMTHKTMTKKQRMMMMRKQQMMKKQEMMQHNM